MEQLKRLKGKRDNTEKEHGSRLSQRFAFAVIQ